MKFEDQIFSQYPIPKKLSVWSVSVDADGEVLPPLYNLEDLKLSCIKDLGSDLFITETMRVPCQNFTMPEDTVGIQYCTLDYQFPGNKRIKYSYLSGTRKLNIIYTPSYVTYRRKLRVSDLDNLEGDRLRFFKSYFLANMAKLELTELKTVELHTDNSTINLEPIEKFIEEQQGIFTSLKPEILVYEGKF